MKKRIALFLTMLIIASLFAGCGRSRPARPSNKKIHTADTRSESSSRTARESRSTDETYGVWATINGEEAFFMQASTSGKSKCFCNFIDLSKDSEAPKIEFTFDRDSLGTVDTFTNEAAVKLTTDAPFYFSYNKDIIALVTKSKSYAVMALGVEDEWVLTITGRHGSVYEGTLSGVFNRGQYHIDATFVMTTDKEALHYDTNPAHQLFERLFGGGTIYDGGTSGGNTSGGGSSGGSSKKTCGICKGSGLCHTCGGTGRVFNDHLNVNAYKTCSTCHGDGQCNGCGGRGYR